MKWLLVDICVKGQEEVLLGALLVWKESMQLQIITYQLSVNMQAAGLANILSKLLAQVINILTVIVNN